MKTINKIDFQFIDEFSAEIGNLQDITPLQKEQLQTCMKLSSYYDVVSNTFDINNIEDIFSEVKGGWINAFLYQIIDNDTREILYDFWVYNEENGIILIHNTTNDIGIYMSDYTFEKANNNPFNKDLNEDFVDLLQATF